VLTLRSRRCRGAPVLEMRDDAAAAPSADDLWTVFELADYPESVQLRTADSLDAHLANHHPVRDFF
jgi:pterin-4a-carbinolamine dehydratase